MNKPRFILFSCMTTFRLQLMHVVYSLGKALLKSKHYIFICGYPSNFERSKDSLEGLVSCSIM